MQLTIKLTGTVNKEPSAEWIALRAIKIQSLVQAEKTDGTMIPTRVISHFCRFFTDRLSAQEYLDWIELSNPGYVTNADISDI